MSHCDAMRTIVLLVVSSLLVGCTSMLAGGRGEAAGNSIGTDSRDAVTIARDDQITSTIRARFARDKDLGAAGLTVETRRGVVTLRGELADFEQRDRAVGLSTDVPGVVRVANQITVRRQ